MLTHSLGNVLSYLLIKHDSMLCDIWTLRRLTFTKSLFGHIMQHILHSVHKSPPAAVLL